MEETTEKRPISPLAITGAVLVILVLVVLFLGRDGKRPLKPIRILTTPAVVSQNSQAILVTFDELNGNPYTFRGQRIRVTGSYTPQPAPDCADADYKGLLIQWALISESLQLNGYGFESVLKLVPEGTSLTVEGIWRLYEGISGCGKGAPQTAIWYLQVERIVQPNPLPDFGPAPDGDEPAPPVTPPSDDGEPVPTTAPDDAGTAVPQPTIQLSTTATATATPESLLTPTALFTTTATLPADGPTATPTNVGATAVPNGQTPTTTATPVPNAQTATNTPPPLNTTPTATTSALSTSTPGPSPTPTPTSDGYPAPGITPTFDPYP
jgi:hypothetical protein